MKVEIKRYVILKLMLQVDYILYVCFLYSTSQIGLGDYSLGEGCMERRFFSFKKKTVYYCLLNVIHTLRVHYMYMHVAANLN